jgi:hypothetical protein
MAYFGVVLTARCTGPHEQSFVDLQTVVATAAPMVAFEFRVLARTRDSS